MTKKPFSRWKWMLLTFGTNRSKHQLAAAAAAALHQKVITPGVASMCSLLSLAASQIFVLSVWLPPFLPCGIPPCCGGPVFNLLLFLWSRPNFLLRSPSSLFSPPYFLHFPSSPLTPHLSFLLCPFLSSSTLFLFPLLLSSLRLPSHASLSTSPLISSSPHVAAQLGATLCAHASPWPPCLHPLLNYSWESSPASGGLLWEERRRVQRE